MPRNAEHGCRQAQSNHDLAAEEESPKSCQVGSQIHDLCVSGSGSDIHSCKPCVDKQQKGSCPGP